MHCRSCWYVTADFKLKWKQYWQEAMDQILKDETVTRNVLRARAHASNHVVDLRTNPPIKFTTFWRKRDRFSRTH
ncbi:hypothetical protein SCLCIDRAFT_1218443 [Scleroderma citrinum Foug A]|uniref:Uncharacterized protein n=1 Tax=Scleroderma citrinum Foug A TaxID=1036808 RepID=A0A0C3A243_9AGAM|nr:hypothetical protein SCLCIDRAFT_1218443 [Scleroderma citrinum Foug A]